MAKRQQFKQSIDEKRRRIFSEDFKRKKVREIEQKITTIAEVSREYEVRASNVSKWLAQFSPNRMKSVRTIVESESDTRKLFGVTEKVAPTITGSGPVLFSRSAAWIRAPTCHRIQGIPIFIAKREYQRMRPRWDRTT